MKATGVSATIKRTINMGDFNSVSFEMTTWGEIEEGETADQAIDSALSLLKAKMSAETRPFNRSVVTANATQKFAGKPVTKEEANGFAAEHGIA